MRKRNRLYAGAKAFWLLTLVLTLAFPGAGALAQDVLEELPAASPQIIRVLLQRLNITDRVDMTLDGVYTAENGFGLTMLFPRGSEVTVLKHGDQIYLYYMGMSLNAGSSLDFKRHAAQEGEENGLRLNNNANLYEGDLSLNVSGDTIRAVLSLHLEDYLLGVVPYEMSDSFPMEALKAQAVTARTYAAGKMNASRAYDLVDTTNDQVFMGKNKANEKAAQAVLETRGVIGWYDGRPAQSYYTASNGGQTEKASHVWGGENPPYLTYVADPYDVLNPLSPVKKFKLDTFSPEFSRDALEVMLPQLKAVLEQNGLVAQADLIRVDKAENAALQTPLYEGSLIMTELVLDVTVAGKKVLGAVLPDSTAIALPEGTPKDEEIWLFATDTPAPTQSPTPEPENLFAFSGAKDPSQSPVPTQSPDPVVYSDYIAIPETIRLTLPLFPALDNALGLSINGSENEVMTLESTDTGYVLYSRRYGHGVGLSQRGAEYMAGTENKTYQDILAFYYPGMALKRYAENQINPPALNPEQLSTPGPRATATPKPTLMPVTGELPAGAWYAMVTEISEDSSLNLRKEPNTASDILMRLYKNQLLVVLGPAEEEGFVKVKTDVTEGYVMESFLTKVTP